MLGYFLIMKCLAAQLQNSAYHWILVEKARNDSKNNTSNVCGDVLEKGENKKTKWLPVTWQSAISKHR